MYLSNGLNLAERYANIEYFPFKQSNYDPVIIKSYCNFGTLLMNARRLYIK